MNEMNACYVLRDDFREALVNSEKIRFAVGCVRTGMLVCTDDS